MGPAEYIPSAITPQFPPASSTNLSSNSRSNRTKPTQQYYSLQDHYFCIEPHCERHTKAYRTKTGLRKHYEAVLKHATESTRQKREHARLHDLNAVLDQLEGISWGTQAPGSVSGSWARGLMPTCKSRGEELAEENEKFEHGKALNANNGKHANTRNTNSMHTRCIPNAKRGPMNRYFNVSEQASSSSRDVPEKVQAEEVTDIESEEEEPAEDGEYIYELDDYEETAMTGDVDEENWEEEEGVQEDIIHLSESKSFRGKENETGRVALRSNICDSSRGHGTLQSKAQPPSHGSKQRPDPHPRTDSSLAMQLPSSSHRLRITILHQFSPVGGLRVLDTAEYPTFDSIVTAIISKLPHSLRCTTIMKCLTIRRTTGGSEQAYDAFGESEWRDILQRILIMEAPGGLIEVEANLEPGKALTK